MTGEFNSSVGHHDFPLSEQDDQKSASYFLSLLFVMLIFSQRTHNS
jgi:hypothetical protein